MSEATKQIFLRFVMPVLGSIVAGAVAAALSCWLMVHLLDSRVTRTEIRTDVKILLRGGQQ